MTTEQETGEQPTEETVGTTQTQTEAEQGSGAKTDNLPPAYSAATDPAQQEARVAGQTVNSMDQPMVQMLDQLVVQAPDQPPVQMPSSPTPLESQAVEEPAQGVDQQSSSPVTGTHPAAQHKLQGIMVDQQVVNIP